jgi:leucyl aminopeptidase
VIIVGLGKREEFKPGSLRSIGGQVGRRLATTKDARAQIELAGALSGAPKVDLEQAGQCFGEGLGLIGWKNWLFKGSAGGDKSKKTDLSVSCSAARFASGMGRGLAVAESANFCRDLSETPPNIATPSWMAAQCKAMAKKTGLKCTVLSGSELERERMTGLINVGKASVNKPCLVRLEYTPKTNKSAKPMVLVGKTMTYDTGGLSLKVNNGMVGMKRDKDGGCAVIGAMHAIATTVRPNRRVVALLAVAENSVSDAAYRPDDVLTYRNGVTVEVTNTDAEGRLVLADAMIWACEKEDPAAVIDLATLTGGVVTALGSTFAGLFCEDNALRDKLARAMDASGERWWRLPMDTEYRDMMKSPIADILNSNPNRKAHPIQGAAFLSYFVTPKTPWAHIDIAGVHAADSDSGCFVKGPTGWGVRLLAEFMAG